MKKIYFLFVILISVNSPISSQDLFSVQKGQFVEQVYGEDLLEEGKDIIDYNGNHLMTGWITNQFEEETTSIDASLWFITNYGEQTLQRDYGVIEYAEIGEGLAQAQGLIYLAIRQTLESNMDQNVSMNDSLIVLCLDSDGIIQWTYKKGLEEGGLAPKDIIVDSNGNIALLANSINSAGTQGSLIIKLDGSGAELLFSNTYYGNTGRGASSYELVEYNPEYYYTICNDLSGSYPISLRFNKYNATNLVANPYLSLKGRFLFGFALKSNGFIYGAGFSVSEGDTDAYVVEINTAFNVNKTKQHGKSGTEKLVDIGQTSDGFIAGGLANNQGEGGWDCYLIQINPTITTVDLEETIGSDQDETLHHMRVKLGDPKAYFAGQTLEFGEEIGNAYVGGSLTFPQGPSGSNCQYERMAYFQEPIYLDPGNNSVIGTNPLIQNKSAFFAMAHKYNIDHIIFYDLDRLFRFYDQDQDPNTGQRPTIGNPATNPSQVAYLDALYYILDLINTAQRNNEGLTFGMAIGAWSEFVDRSVEVAGVFNTSNLLNATNPGKISFFVLEHEFWNSLNNYNDPIEDEAGFRKSQRINALMGANLPLNVSILGALNNSAFNAVSDANKAEVYAAYYYFQLLDHVSFLRQFALARASNGNIHAFGDYLGSIQGNFSHTNATFWSGNEVYFSNYDVNTATGNPTTTSKGGQEDLIVGFLLDGFTGTPLGNLPGADGIFSTYYISPTTPIVDYLYSVSTHNSTYTYEKLGSYTSSNKVPLIPLFSAEEAIVCTGNTSNPTSFMGPWLSGANNPKYAEDQWVDQNIAAYKGTGASNASSCVNCFTNTQVTAMAWFTMDCLDENQKKSSAVPYTNFGQSSCNGTNTYIGEDELTVSEFSVYPNPVINKVTLKANGQKEGVVTNVRISNLNGSILYSGSFIGLGTTLDITDFASGIYFLHLSDNTNSNLDTFKLVKMGI